MLSLGPGPLTRRRVGGAITSTEPETVRTLVLSDTVLRISQRGRGPVGEPGWAMGLHGSKDTRAVAHGVRASACHPFIATPIDA